VTGIIDTDSIEVSPKSPVLGRILGSMAAEMSNVLRRMGFYARA